MKPYRISICTAKSCCQRDPEMQQAVKTGRNPDGTELDTELVEVTSCGCLGQCYKGPNILIENLRERTREVKNGMSVKRLNHEIRSMRAGKRPPIMVNARKKLNDYLSGGF